MNLHFGLGDATLVENIMIEWPSGFVQRYQDVSVDQFIEFEEVSEANIHYFMNTSGNVEAGVTSLGNNVFYVASSGDKVYRLDDKGEIL